MTGKKNALELSDEVLANESDETQGHEKKLSRYAKAKQHQVNVADHILQHESTLNKELVALQDCSNHLIFRHWYTVHQYRLIGGCTCKKHLLCAMCALRRSAKTVKEVEKKVLAVMSENPDLVPVLITTTVVNNESLKERYEHITGCKKKLLQARRHALKDSKRRKTLSVTRFIHGSFGSYEFKKGSGGHGWHPHSHEIALLDSSVRFTSIVKKGKEVDCPIEFEQDLQREWLNLTQDSHVIDVRRVNDTNDPENENSLLNVICEASKYALKMNDMEIEDQVHAYKVLRGRRLTFTYGSLWGIKIPDDLNDTIEKELELQPYVDLIYSFYSGKYNLTDITDTGDTLTGRKSLEPKKKVSPHDRLASSMKYAKEVKEYYECDDIEACLASETEQDLVYRDEQYLLSAQRNKTFVNDMDFLEIPLNTKPIEVPF